MIYSTPQQAYTPGQINALIAVAAGVQFAAAVPVIVNQDRPVLAAVLAGAAAALTLVAALTYGVRSRVGAPSPEDPTVHVLLMLLCCGALLWPALVLMLLPSVLAVFLGLALGSLWVAIAGLVLTTWRARTTATTRDANP